VPCRELQVVVDLVKAGGDPWQGSITIPGLNIQGTQLVDIAVQDSDASFGIKTSRGLEATFKGHFGADGSFSGDLLNGTLEARDANTGELLWDYQTEASKQNKGWVLTADRRFNQPFFVLRQLGRSSHSCSGPTS
jgi:hypothetical protein